MRLNLINYIQDMETTKVKRITGEIYDKEGGRCALGICGNEMISMFPDKWGWGLGGTTNPYPTMIDYDDPKASYFKFIADHLGISEAEICQIFTRNDGGMGFKGNAKYIYELLTDEEKALFSKMKEQKQELVAK